MIPTHMDSKISIPITRQKYIIPYCLIHGRTAIKFCPPKHRRANRNLKIAGEVLGSHGEEYDEDILLGYCAVKSRISRGACLHQQRDDGGSTHRRNVGLHLRNYIQECRHIETSLSYREKKKSYHGLTIYR